MKEKEAVKKGINLEELKEEQKKLSTLVDLKDAFDFSQATSFGGIICETSVRDLIAVIVVLDEKGEIIEKKFSIQKPKFPYIPGFRAYRELPVMIEAYKKLEEEPDVIFILGHGISHPQGLGIASHLGISINKPVIGISKNLIIGKEQGENVTLNGKIIAKKITTKEKSNPIYISSGHMISLKSCLELVKKLTREPHKLPEPIVQARKFLKEVREEMSIK
jgi:deoxyribonuclease V